MDSINITNARKDLYNLVARTQDSHEPVQIIGKNAAAVLVSSEDWDAIMETLYLVNIPCLLYTSSRGVYIVVSKSSALSYIRNI